MTSLRALLLSAAFALLSTAGSAQILLTTTLSGNQENPPVISTGQGTAWAVLSSDMKTLTYRVTYAELSSARVGAHFHAGGTGGGSVVLPLSFTGNSAAGTWSNLPDSIIAHLLRGEIYVNIHTTNNPGGEIRGYFQPVQGIGYTIALDGSQENPPNSSTATGTAWAVLDSEGARLTYAVTVAGLSGTFSASHFHLAPSGSVIHPITFTDSSSQGIWSGFPDGDLTALMTGNVYLNVHSSAFPGGEIRGSLTSIGPVTFNTTLDGAQENPPVITSGEGTAWVVLSADLTTLTYRATYANLSAARTGAHFHVGGTGGGAVVHPLTFTGNSVAGSWIGVPDSVVRHMLKGELYINVHSSNFPGGEIRGYFWVPAGVGFITGLDGSQESPSNASTATGTAWAVLDSAGARLSYNATVAGLTGSLTAAHFHVAPAGTVVHPVSFVDSSATGAWSGVPVSDLTALSGGNLYLNVHSTAFPGGEIRGYLMTVPQLTTGVAAGAPGIAQGFRLDQNYPNPFNPTTVISYQLSVVSSVRLVVYDILGREVATLVNERKAAGTYSVTFNASGLASGFYVYRLSTSAGINESRKMVLVK